MLRTLQGSLFMLPFLCLNFIVVVRLQPFFSWLRPGVHTSPQEIASLIFSLLLMPVGAFYIAAPNGQPKAGYFRWISLIVACLMLGAFLALAIGLGEDFYACEVLARPNCD